MNEFQQSDLYMIFALSKSSAIWIYDRKHADAEDRYISIGTFNIESFTEASISSMITGEKIVKTMPLEEYAWKK